MGKFFFKLFTVILASIFAFSSSSSGQAVERYQRATSINFLWQGETVGSAGDWLYREVQIRESADASYFAIIGNWTPPFYMGVQELTYRTGATERVALFSAWDTYDDNNCTDCGSDTRFQNGSLTKIKSLGDGVTPGEFGSEGTGVQAWMNGFDWLPGDQIRAAVHLKATDAGTELSAAIQKNEDPWRHFGTFVYSNSFSSLQPGYSFIEDFGGFPYKVRSAVFGNSWMEDENLESVEPLTGVTARRNEDNPEVNPTHVLRKWSGSSVFGQIGGLEGSTERQWLSASLPDVMFKVMPLEARLAALNLTGAEAQEYSLTYQANLAQLKKVWGSVGAGNKTITCKLGTKTKRVTATKPKCPAGYSKVKTIKCVKGTSLKKVRGVRPKCPSGYTKNP